MVLRLESSSIWSTMLQSVSLAARLITDGVRSSLITGCRAPNRGWFVNVFPRRRAGMPGHPGDDEKSCWRSSTEYNSIWPRSSSARRRRLLVLTANAVIAETDLFA